MTEDWGAMLPPGGSLHFGTRVDDNGDPIRPLRELRFDTWPLWLQVSRREGALAVKARSDSPREQLASGAYMLDELLHGINSVCATAIAIEAFTSDVGHALPRAQVPWSPGSRSSSASRIHQTWVRAFKIENRHSKQLRDQLTNLFELRNTAVHPSPRRLAVVRHDEYPLDVHPYFVDYRGAQAEELTKFAFETIGLLAARPQAGKADWIRWCRFVPSQLERVAMD